MSSGRLLRPRATRARVLRDVKRAILVSVPWTQNKRYEDLVPATTYEEGRLRVQAS